MGNTCHQGPKDPGGSPWLEPIPSLSSWHRHQCSWAPPAPGPARHPDCEAGLPTVTPHLATVETSGRQGRDLWGSPCAPQHGGHSCRGTAGGVCGGRGESQVQALAPPAVRVGSRPQHCCPRAHAWELIGAAAVHLQMLVEETGQRGYLEMECAAGISAPFPQPPPACVSPDLNGIHTSREEMKQEHWPVRMMSGSRGLVRVQALQGHGPPAGAAGILSRSQWVTLTASS